MQQAAEGSNEKVTVDNERLSREMEYLARLAKGTNCDPRVTDVCRELAVSRECIVRILSSRASSRAMEYLARLAKARAVSPE